VHIIIIGLGEVGRHLIHTLELDQHDIVAIDSDPAAVSRCEEQHDVMTILGYGAATSTLKAANAQNADLVVAVSNNDEVNLLAALGAKDLGAKQVIARVQGIDWSSLEEGISYGHLGVDVIINPQVVVAMELAQIARSHGALHVIELADHHIELAQVELAENSRLLNRSLQELKKVLPEQTLIGAVVRRGELFIPGGSDVLLPGDQVYIVGKPNNMSAAEDLFTRKKEAHTVVIAGHGVVGLTLANELGKHDITVYMIVKDETEARQIDADTPDVHVLCGDPTDLNFLEGEGVGDADLFVSTFTDDEDNLLASLIAKKAGVVRTAALVQRAGHMEIYKQLGIDIVLSSRIICSEQIMRYCSHDNVESMTVLEEGQAEVIEIQAKRSSRAVGIPLRQMRPPRGVLIAAILRATDGHDVVVIPTGDTVIERDDRVIVIATKDNLASVTHLFKERDS
jgi:trk system potassium uptake protein TrkA